MTCNASAAQIKEYSLDISSGCLMKAAELPIGTHIATERGTGMAAATRDPVPRVPVAAKRWRPCVASVSGRHREIDDEKILAAQRYGEIDLVPLDAGKLAQCRHLLPPPWTVELAR